MLAEGSIAVGFQPVVALAARSVVGYEALARGPAGTEHEDPSALFAAARDAERPDELDWLCRRTALRAAVEGGLRARAVLFLNVAADTSGFLPLDLRGLYAQATGRMVVAVEVKERALTQRPAGLLGRMADMHALGCIVALHDVGSARDSLAMMAVLAPDVGKGRRRPDRGRRRGAARRARRRRRAPALRRSGRPAWVLRRRRRADARRAGGPACAGARSTPRTRSPASGRSPSSRRTSRPR